MKKLIYHLVVVLFVVSCSGKMETKSGSEEGVQKESLEAKEAISSINKKIEGFYKAKQMDSAIVYFSDNAIQFPPNSKPLEGKDSIKKFWQTLFQFGEINCSFETQDVKANGPLAIELGKYMLTFIAVSNSPIPTFSDTGNYLVHWQKIDNNWKVVWDAPVSTVSMPGH